MAKKRRRCEECKDLERRLTKVKKELDTCFKGAAELGAKLSDERRKTEQMDRAIRSLECDLDKEKGRVKEMLEEYYDLGRCLSATREKWYDAECRLREKTTTYRIEAQMADGTNEQDGVKSPPRGAGAP